MQHCDDECRLRLFAEAAPARVGSLAISIPADR